MEPEPDGDVDDFLSAVRLGHLSWVESHLKRSGLDPLLAYDLAISLLDGNEKRREILAALLCDPFVVERLLSEGKLDPTAGSNAALRSLARYGNVKSFQNLCQHPLVDPLSAYHDALVRPDSDRNRFFILGAILENPKVANDLLLSIDLDPAALSNSPIRALAYCGHFKSFLLLAQDKRVDLYAEDYEVLHWASDHRFPEILEYCVQHLPKWEVDSSRKEDTLFESLQLVIKKGNMDCLRIILRVMSGMVFKKAYEECLIEAREDGETEIANFIYAVHSIETAWIIFQSNEEDTSMEKGLQKYVLVVPLSEIDNIAERMNYWIFDGCRVLVVIQCTSERKNYLVETYGAIHYQSIQALREMLFPVSI